MHVERQRYSVLVGLLISAASVPAGAIPSLSQQEKAGKAAIQVQVSCPGASLHRLAAELTKHTGVQVTIDRQLGDERVIAFVPKAPLRQVLAALGSLYRLRLDWRVDREKASVRLARDIRTRNDEASARERDLRALWEAASAAGTKPDSQLLHLALNALRTPSSSLDRDGAAAIRLESISREVREPLLRLLLPVLDRVRRETGAIPRQGARQVLPGMDDPPAPPLQPADMVLLGELQAREQLELWVGVNNGAGGTCTLGTVTAPSGDAGRSLYTRVLEQTPSLPQVYSGGEMGGDAVHSWTDRLRHVSETTGLAVYSDWYAAEARNSGRSRDWRLVSEGKPLDETLNRMVGGKLPVDRELHAPPHTFWWSDGQQVWFRDSDWLWKSMAVLPPSLPEALARQFLKHQPLDADTVQALGGLSLYQIRSCVGHPGRLDTWRFGVALPAGLSPGARGLLAGPGIDLQSLPTADQRLLVAKLASLSGQEPSRYTSRVEAHLARGASGEGFACALTVVADWGQGRRSATFRIPLPMVDVKTGQVEDPIRVELVSPA